MPWPALPSSAFIFDLGMDLPELVSHGISHVSNAYVFSGLCCIALLAEPRRSFASDGEKRVIGANLAVFRDFIMSRA